jgi:hypothetical protein
LFGEEYARGLFLVRMREEMRKYNLPEAVELPDHITHVLAVIGAMPEDEAKRFVTACVLPAVAKMKSALDDKASAYKHVVAGLADVLQHVWGNGESLSDGSESNHHDAHSASDGVDLLHRFPVADVNFGCGEQGCGDHGCGSSSDSGLVQLSLNENGIPTKGTER